MPLSEITPAGYLLWVAVPDSRWSVPVGAEDPVSRRQVAENAAAGAADFDPAYVGPIIAWAGLGTGSPRPVTPHRALPAAGGEDGPGWFVHPGRGDVIRLARDFAERAHRQAVDACAEHRVVPVP